MRCTSSDLIIDAASRRRASYVVAFSDGKPGSTFPENALVRGRRVPKSQESVKVEALDRLHRAGGLDLSRQPPQAERVKDGDRRRMQERQVAQPIAQPVVADRRLRIDVLGRREPGD